MLNLFRRFTWLFVLSFAAHGVLYALNAVAEPPTASDAGADRATIESILERLEKRGDTVSDLKCAVEYSIEDVLADDEFTKFGEIRYKKREPNPVFFIHFNKLHQAGFVSQRKEWWIFDGRYVWEIKEAAKNKIQHEVVKPGEKIDLFDIEKSPIPIPFGQKKDQILKNFKVVLVHPTASDPPDTDHLICQPKPESNLANEVDRLEFYVSRKLHLPIKIISVDRGGNKISTAVFPDLSEKSLNSGLKDSAFDHPREARKWKTVTAEPGG